MANGTNSYGWTNPGTRGGFGYNPMAQQRGGQNPMDSWNSQYGQNQKNSGGGYGGYNSMAQGRGGQSTSGYGMGFMAGQSPMGQDGAYRGGQAMNNFGVGNQGYAGGPQTGSYGGYNPINAQTGGKVTGNFAGAGDGTAGNSSNKSSGYQGNSFTDFLGMPDNPFNFFGGVDNVTNGDFWRSNKNAGAYQAYSQNFLQPMYNAWLAGDAQAFNQYYNERALGMQDWMNQQQNQLAWSGDTRENQALQAQLRFNERDFAANQERWGQEYGLNMQDANTREQAMRNEYLLGTGNIDLQRQLGMGNIDLQRQLGLGDQDIRRLQSQREFELGGRAATTAEGQLALQRELGTGELGLSRDRFGLEGELGRGNLSLQQELGRGGLALDTQRFQSDAAYRNAALAQEAALMRERIASDERNAAMNAFGRSQTPAFRQMNAWR